MVIAPFRLLAEQIPLLEVKQLSRFMIYHSLAPFQAVEAIGPSHCVADYRKRVTRAKQMQRAVKFQTVESLSDLLYCLGSLYNSLAKRTLRDSQQNGVERRG